jgi:hypothetical protein
MRSPEPAEPGQPGVDVLHASAVDGVQPPLTFWPNGGKTVVPQYLQVLRHRRLTDGEFGLDRRRDRTGGLFTGRQQFQDPPAHRVPQDIEGVHPAKI